MKQLYRYLFLIFLMICIYKIGFSQQAISGYMINQKNDTVKCWIYETEYGVPKFELTDKNDFTKIDPDEIKEYKTDNVKNPHVAVSLKPGKRKQFLLRLEGGPVQLFELQRTMSQSAPPMMQPMAAGNISMSVGVGIPTDKKQLHYMPPKTLIRCLRLPLLATIALLLSSLLNKSRVW